MSARARTAVLEAVAALGMLTFCAGLPLVIFLIGTSR